MNNIAPGALDTNLWDNTGRACVIRWSQPDAEGCITANRIGPIYDSEDAALRALDELASMESEVRRLDDR